MAINLPLIFPLRRMGAIQIAVAVTRESGSRTKIHGGDAFFNENDDAPVTGISCRDPIRGSSLAPGSGMWCCDQRGRFHWQLGNPFDIQAGPAQQGPELIQGAVPTAVCHQ